MAGYGHAYRLFLALRAGPDMYLNNMTTAGLYSNVPNGHANIDKLERFSLWDTFKFPPCSSLTLIKAVSGNALPYTPLPSLSLLQAQPG